MSASYSCVSFDVYAGNNARVVVKITKMTGTCRLCLKESTKLSPIFCNKQGREHFFDLYRKIFICCGIDINEYDELSSFICNECVTKLNAAYDFRLLCQRSNSSYCRLQAHTSQLCICSNPNAETEISKVKKIIKICQSTDIHEKYVKGTVEEKQDRETNNNFQVNGISTINSDDNQVNGLSAKNADEKSDNLPDASTTDRPDSSIVGSKTIGVSINHKSSKSPENDNDNDIDDLSYEKRLEIARNKYKDILVLNRLNIPPKKTADLIKLNNYMQKGDTNNINIGGVAGGKQKDVDDVNSSKGANGKNSQVKDNDESINQTREVTVASRNNSVDENADEQIEDTDVAVYVQPNIVSGFDHTYDLPEQIIITFDENIQVQEEIAIQIDDNQEISTIIFQNSDQKTTAAVEEEEEEVVDEEELDSFTDFTHEEQTENAKVDEGIEEQVINASDILDKGNKVFTKDSNLIVKDSDSSIEKPKKYFKSNSQVPNESKIKVDRIDKNLSSRKRFRSQELHDPDEVSSVPDVDQDEFKRRKSAKTKKFSSKKRREDIHRDLSEEEGVVSSGNSIEVQAEVHVREQNSQFSGPTSKIIGSNVVAHGGVNRNKSQNISKINEQYKIFDDLDQILNLEDDIAIEVAHNIEILPDDMLSVDYTVGIPDDDIKDSSDAPQVPKSNLTSVANDNYKELNKKKNVGINNEKKNTRLKNSKSKSPVSSDDDDEEKEKDDDQLQNNSVNKYTKVLNKEKNKSRGILAVKKNVKSKVLSINKLKEKKYKVKFPSKRLNSKKKLAIDEESTEEDEIVGSDEDNDNKTSNIIQSNRSRVKQLSSSDENLIDRLAMIDNNNKKLVKSQRRKSSPVRPSNSSKIRKKQSCKYCDKNFLYHLPLLKHIKQQHSDVSEDSDTSKTIKVRHSSSPVSQILYKSCYVNLNRILYKNNELYN